MKQYYTVIMYYKLLNSHILKTSTWQFSFKDINLKIGFFEFNLTVLLHELRLND